MERRPWWLPGDFVPRLVAPLAEMVDRRVGWDRLTPRMGIVALLGIRHRLRARNLYDTRRRRPAPAAPASVVGERSGVRALDGAGTDPGIPALGTPREPFGRNAPPLEDDARGPSAREVSDALLTRQEFFGAETLNLLAAAWLQFEVHDWFAHATEDYRAEDVERYEGGIAAPKALLQDREADPRHPPFISDQTHWWDASQLYGAREDFAAAVREGSSCRVKDGLDLLEAMEPFTAGGGGHAAPAPNLWVGTALFHILFAREHNAICARLAEAHPTWDEQRLYDKARLINAAVMAKIHTVEWTPAIVAHPASAAGARKIWNGVVPREKRPLVARFRDEILTGIPGSRHSHDGAPYALTEEFVAVYRMHQLIPDEVAFVTPGGESLDTRGIGELTIEHGHPGRPREQLDELGFDTAVLSLALSHPGEITLHNHPTFLQEYRPADGEGLALNLGEVDILRTRQTCVPRYNDFRRLFRLEPARSFHDVANGNPKWAKEIRDVYSGRLEDVDLLVGMFAERKPRGFAFSDTAFRVFLLMAARRLRSDRFFTTDYTPEVYTPEGMRWIEEATLAGMLRNHTSLEVPDDVFAPWA
jgi:hypothetical protein